MVIMLAAFTKRLLTKVYDFFVCCFCTYATDNPSRGGALVGRDKGSSVYTVSRVGDDPDSYDRSFDLAIIGFEDDGSFVKPNKLDLTSVARVITDARQADVNGVVVVVFIHGWHHNAAWDIATHKGDEHFAEFRRVLMTLTLREAERNDKKTKIKLSRRVIGVYIGWNGDPVKGWLRWLRHVPLVTHCTFPNRLKTARTISESSAIQDTIREIVDRTKRGAKVKDAQTNEERVGLDSPLIFLGHSMGALILERAFVKLLENSDPVLLCPHQPVQKRPVELTSHGVDVTFPDLLLLINSAAHSDTATDLRTQLKRLEIQKKAVSDQKNTASDPIEFWSPVVVSMTSPCDLSTRIFWPVVNRFAKAEGHDESLFTHTFDNERREFICAANYDDRMARLSFGQAWHCLRFPEPRNSVHPMSRPIFRIDLPKGFPLDEQNKVKRQHVRYVLSQITPKPPPDILESSQKEAPCPFWIFQVPSDISASHNDIFNFRSSLLILALMQICGEVMSLATTWEDVFEEET